SFCKGLLGVRARARVWFAVSFSSASRQVPDAARSGVGCRQAPEGRAVQALGYALAVGSGLLLALSFPKFGHPVCGRIALVPLMFALMRRSSERPVLLGWVAGLVYFSGTLYWITHVMATYGGLSLWIAVPLNAGLIAYLAMFPAVFAALAGRFVRTRGVAG